ncbi:MAG: ATP-binding protein [Roseburia sp.]|nr:ATP-binding protein [Anaeroplasma bactoclasticum]MCM1196764.1 ATP-binding protein [Roseburia sp.]MCM1557236.1 ATP-binding protein [Anaeroplasma bactoclasticum]
MRKVNIESNEKDVLDFVEQLKKDPLLEGYDINAWNANDFSIFLEEQRTCKICKGLVSCKNINEGYMLKPEENSFVLVPCKYKKEANKKENENQRIKTLTYSKKLLQADLKDYDISTANRRKIYEYIVKFIQNMKENIFTKGLFVFGDIATGKTFILGCIANELARNGIESLNIYFPDLVVDLKNAIGTSRFGELINHLKSVDVLLLDDLGSENMTPWLRDEVLGPVLNYRLMEEKPVFISSNLDPKTDDFVEYLATTKSSSDNLKALRIKSRLEGLVKDVKLDNAKYKR